MGFVSVPELGGKVRIKGESPTPEEMQRIREAVRQRRTQTAVPRIQERVAQQPQGFTPSLRRPAAELGAGQVQQEEAARQQAARTEAIRSFVGPATGGLAALTAATGGLSAPVTAPAALAAAAGGAAGSALSQLATQGRVDPSTVTEEAAFEGLSAGVGALGLGGLRLGVKRFANVDEAAMELNQRFGLRASLEDISGGGVVGGFRTTLGQLPTQAAPFRRSSARRASDLSDTLKRTLGFIVPGGTGLEAIDESQLGRQLFQRATGRFKAFQRLAKAQREQLDRVLDANPDASIPTTFSRQAAEQILERTGSQIVPGRTIASRTSGNLLKGPENLTVRQYKQLQRAISQKKAAAARGAAKGDPIVEDLFELEKALEKDFLNIQGNPEVVESMRNFATFFSEGMKQFEGPVAKTIGRVDRNAFRFGFQLAGDTQPDELAVKLFNQSRVLDSPTGVQEVRNLVGVNPFRRAVAKHLERQIDDALKIGRRADGRPTGDMSLDVNKLKESLGLFKPRSARRNATEEMLRGSGVSVKQLEDFFRVVEQAAKIDEVRTSQFIARRVTLGGGVGALVGSGGVGFVAGGGPGAMAGGVLGIMALRGFGEAITNPRALEIGSKLVRPGVSQTAATQGLFRLSRVLGVDPLQTREFLDELERAPERVRSLAIPALP